MLPGKRGSHLALSLERLERLSECRLQRIGLSATVRPVEEVAEFLGGAIGTADAFEPSGRRRRVSRTASRAQQRDDAAIAVFGGESDARRRPRFRPVAVVDARQPKTFRLSIEMPPDAGATARHADGALASEGSGERSSIWSSIHPRLLALIRAHRSTLVFVNNRRLAERLAAALNELAGEAVAKAHHGSLAREHRITIEEALKRGELPALIATSSLELGIDMGAIDLVVQIEAPPSVASGLQRIGRAGHQVDGVSEGIVFPKFRSDLVSCAAVSAAMEEGLVESTRYPRNPLDVLAQQVVAMVSMDDWSIDDLLATVRSAASFARLDRRAFESVLDMLSGRYPSDDFAELRPRITWDRASGALRAREGARRIAVANAGTIPDRGLYGVFLSGARKGTGRVGELDEEMVFESRVGDRFVLGASTWRIDEITHDRVLVVPSPGEPGKMPFWRGDRPARPVELGRAIGRLMRELSAGPREASLARLAARHHLDPGAAEQLLGYLAEQEAATGTMPDDRTIVIERCRDELGDWRVCLLSPFGARVHAPWAMAAVARIRDERGLDVETMWTDEGFVIRWPDTGAPPEAALLVPSPAHVDSLVMKQLGGTALFAGTFREVASRALLLPRRRPGRRAPLWQQRKRASDLLAAASRFGSFPAVLEAYRECLQDQFDLPALTDLLGRIAAGSIRVRTVEAATPSPFAAALLFTYVGNYLYDGDAPLAERRAQALAVDQSQLRQLLGEAELRELLDAAVIDEVEAELQHLATRYRARSADAVHDMLLRVGDMTETELAARCSLEDVASVEDALERDGRILRLSIAGESRLVAVEDAARFRDALGVRLPASVPERLRAPASEASVDLARRYARTHGPFRPEEFARRFGLGVSAASALLGQAAATGRLVAGEFIPGGSGRDWCDAEVLRQIRQRSLARLRRQVEPVDANALGRFLVGWQGVGLGRRGLEPLLDVVEQLQGAPLHASDLERAVLPTRLADYDPSMLDTLMAAGEVVWIGLESVGERDGRIALYLADRLADLRPETTDEAAADGRERSIIDLLQRRGASFFADVHEACGGGYPAETVRSLWNLVWRGLVTNDAMHPLRAWLHPASLRRRDSRAPFRSRRLVPPSAEGRWVLVASLAGRSPTPAGRMTALARQWLARYGIVTREWVGAEAIRGGFGPLYTVLKAMEERGSVRRGYFVAGLGAAQFATAEALERLRSFRDPPDVPAAVCLASTDPANPYGTLLGWPAPNAGDEGRATNRGGPARVVGSTVVLIDGSLTAWLARNEQRLSLFLPAAEPERGAARRTLAEALARLARGEEGDRPGLLLTEIDGLPARQHPFSADLSRAGFDPTTSGLLLARRTGERK